MATIQRALFLTLAGAIALGVSACSDPNEGKAPFAPPAGETREVFTNQSAELTLKVPQMNIDGAMTQTRAMTLHLTPEAAGSDGTVKLTATIDYASAESGGALLPTQELDLSPLYDAYAGGLMGKSISATIGADGNVVSMSDVETLAEEVNSELDGDSIPDGLGENAEQTVRGIFQRLLGDDEIRNTLEHVVMPRSLEVLDPGVTWTRQAKVDFGLIPTNATYTYTVKERTDTNVTIEEAGTYELDPDGTGLISMFENNEVVKAMGEPTVTLNGTGLGSYDLDPETGWTNSYEGTITLTGKFTVGPLNADLGVNVVHDYSSVPQ